LENVAFEALGTSLAGVVTTDGSRSCFIRIEDKRILVRVLSGSLPRALLGGWHRKSVSTAEDGLLLLAKLVVLFLEEFVHFNELFLEHPLVELSLDCFFIFFLLLLYGGKFQLKALDLKGLTFKLDLEVMSELLLDLDSFAQLLSMCHGAAGVLQVAIWSFKELADVWVFWRWLA